MNFEQQRRHTRIDANLLMYFEQRDQKGRMRLNTVGHVLNLSEGGLLAELSCEIEPDLDTEVVLALGADCLGFRTRLARLERISPHCFHLALKIDRRSSRVRSRIAQYVGQKSAA